MGSWVLRMSIENGVMCGQEGVSLLYEVDGGQRDLHTPIRRQRQIGIRDRPRTASAGRAGPADCKVSMAGKCKHHAGWHDPVMNAASTDRSGAVWPIRAHLELHEELHARPAMPVRSPGVVSYWAQQGMDAATALSALRILFERMGHGFAPERPLHCVAKSVAFAP